ncbi:uncharacterized protein NEMAJ01_0790 [Nematocida major]|uniref:uncharacterized protein n=1 Tax=Nematocida major TaxID=1912982 RepID=UPI0020081220|nr:uncharacterized protein NEMAJ01_0790 [Nematocida major]KAH9385894.1 hypothetical protein NEMAJ01_0790 [Nematocida major]
MHEGRFNYEEKETPKTDTYISTTVLNTLIYEYLIKRNYIGSAKVFKVEGDISNINITQGSSALLDWFVAFNDLYNVRSGRGKPTGITGKIDAILEKTAKEEQEYKPRPGNPNNPEPRIPQKNHWYKDEGDLLDSILEIDEPRNTPNTPNNPKSLAMKEVLKLRLHTQKINSISICQKNKIVVTGGMDASICVLDLLNMADVIKFESHSMQISQVKVKESSAEGVMHFGSASLDREAKVYKVSREAGKLGVSLFLCLKGHKSSVKALDFSPSKIYTMGIDGELRIWGMDGLCLGAFALRRTVKMMFSRSDSLIAVCDVNTVSLFNPESATYVKELSSKGALAFHKTPTNSILVFPDGVSIYDKTFHSKNSLPFSSDKIQSVCAISGRLFLGGYQAVYEVHEKSVQKVHAHDGMVCALEGTPLGSKTLLLTGSQNGELKVWEVFDRPSSL